MESIAIKCPGCTGITEVPQEKTQGYCQYCGTILYTEQPEAEVFPEKNESEGLLTVWEDVNAQYFDGAQLFDEVLAAYAHLEVSEAHHSEFWLERARFFAQGNMKEFEEGRLMPKQCKEVVDQYVEWMDIAIETHEGSSTPLKMEKEKTIGDINNTFEGQKKREENEAREKARLEEQRQLEVIDEAALAAEEMEELVTHNKKRNIMIAIAGLIVLGLFALLLRSCMRNNVDVTYYEKFLTLSYIFELLDEEITREEVLDLNLNFGTRNTEARSIRILAPTNADLDRITFHFDEDDLLTRIAVYHANYFNGIAATDGLDQLLFSDFDVEELEVADDTLVSKINGYAVLIRLTQTTPSQFNVVVSRSEEALTLEQQEIWDRIEARLIAGYGSWADLVTWALEQDIAFSFFEDGDDPIEAIRLLINRYGLVGDYIEATPRLGSLNNPEEIILALHFDHLTYNTVVAELTGLNRTSNRELDTWLDANGRRSLDDHFEQVEIVNLNEAGQVLTELPEAVEFILWEIEDLDLFTPMGVGRIRIERTYRILEIEDEDDDEDDDEGEDEDDEEVTTPEPSGPTVLSSGSWVVGTDISQGRFEITGDGAGNFSIWRGASLMTNEFLDGGHTGVSRVTTYLLNGDRIEITGTHQVTFNPVTSRTLSNTLGAGNWVVGVDIGAGQFDVTTPSGSGHLIVWRGDSLVTSEILDGGSTEPEIEPVQVNLINGDIITISGLEHVVFD
ncbi:MAG: hypothetical protein FWG67_08430 [Defluviitaleaceae bacterium]|nr:hypothetical protein [Defluviitaleaceae bacterium]